MKNADIVVPVVMDMAVHIPQQESMLQKVMRMNASTADPEAMDMVARTHLMGNMSIKHDFDIHR